MVDVRLSPFSLYGNIFLNSEHKMELAIKSLSLWTEYLGAVSGLIRVRGAYSNDFDSRSRDITRGQNLKVIQGSDFIKWRNQAIFDLEGYSSKYIFLFLEDHIPAPASPPFREILSQLQDQDCDLLQYSWYPQYSKWRNRFLRSDNLKCERVVSYEVDNNSLSALLQEDFRWVISITGIYKRSFLLGILKSSFPIIKKTNPRAPFDLEKNPESTRFLPCKLGLPVNEIGICVDDDNTIFGSSAMSRGIVSLDGYSRIANHHASIAPLSIVSKARNFELLELVFKALPIRLKKLLGRWLLVPTYLVNTVESVIFEIIDNFRLAKKTFKK